MKIYDLGYLKNNNLIGNVFGFLGAGNFRDKSEIQKLYYCMNPSKLKGVVIVIFGISEASYG